jgi:hypothetical protein
VVTSHGSQSVNLIFLHPSSAAIELTPIYFNNMQARLAEKSGVYYQFGFGGSILNSTHPSLFVSIPSVFSDCFSILSQCNGNSFCVEKKQTECLIWKYSLRLPVNVKNFNFIFPYQKLKPLIQRALIHIQHNCNGKWEKPTPTHSQTH